jgi:CubicO group peptidase (beta-lactamase class C family)
MKIFLPALFSLVASLSGIAQSGYYFPPVVGSAWDTVSPQSLGWCTDKLDSVIDYAGQKDSKSFIILYKGKIVTEKYYGSFTKDSVWYWASAGKSLTSFLTGVAQEEGLLSIHDSTSKYLGVGWSSETPEQEGKIKIVHQLSMTTGLDYNVPDQDCTVDTCLKYKSDAGTAWYYHNAPYHLVQDVIASAAGVSFNNYTTTHVGSRVGITGLWYDHIFYSKPRSAARFGLLMLNNAVWNNDTLLHDQQYLHDSRNTSQNFNLSYGYLWWLNGKSSFMAPTTTVVFPGSLCPAAPADMYSALGKNDQKIYVVPSMDLVVVRMGNTAGQQTLGPSSFDSDLWEKLMQVFCSTTSVANVQNEAEVKLFPNPANNQVSVRVNKELIGKQLLVFDISGRELFTAKISNVFTGIDISGWPAGIYFFKVGSEVRKLVKE